MCEAQVFGHSAGIFEPHRPRISADRNREFARLDEAWHFVAGEEFATEGDDLLRIDLVTRLRHDEALHVFSAIRVGHTDDHRLLVLRVLEVHLDVEVARDNQVFLAIDDGDEEPRPLADFMTSERVIIEIPVTREMAARLQSDEARRNTGALIEAMLALGSAYPDPMRELIAAIKQEAAESGPTDALWLTTNSRRSMPNIVFDANVLASRSVEARLCA